jgi:hypothetical protein
VVVGVGATMGSPRSAAAVMMMMVVSVFSLPFTERSVVELRFKASAVVGGTLVCGWVRGAEGARRV